MRTIPKCGNCGTNLGETKWLKKIQEESMMYRGINEEDEEHPDFDVCCPHSSDFAGIHISLAFLCHFISIGAVSLACLAPRPQKQTNPKSRKDNNAHHNREEKGHNQSGVKSSVLVHTFNVHHREDVQVDISQCPSERRKRGRPLRSGTGWFRAGH